MNEPCADNVLARRPNVDWVEVDGEIVAWNAEAQSLHLLNPMASVIYQLFDGETTLEVTSVELAEACGEGVGPVRDEVLRFARALLQIGVAEVLR